MQFWLVCLLLCAAGAHAGEPPATGRISVQIVLPGGTTPAETLGSADFEVLAGTELCSIQAIERAPLPLDLVLAVESRRWDPPDLVLLPALQTLAAHLDSGDRIGFLTAGGEVKALLPAGIEPGRLNRLLSSRPFGRIGAVSMPLPRPVTAEFAGPALLDAVASAAASLQWTPVRQAAILVLAPDCDRSSRGPLARVTGRAASAGAIVSVFTLPEEPVLDPHHPNPPYPRTRAPRRPPAPTAGQSLSAVVRATGGEIAQGGHAELIAQLERIRTRYRITFVPPAPSLGPITVSLSARGRVAYPRAAVLAIPLPPAGPRLP